MHLVRGISPNHGINMHLVRGLSQNHGINIHLVTHYIFLFLRNDALFAKVTVFVISCQYLSIFGQFVNIVYGTACPASARSSYSSQEGINSKGNIIDPPNTNRV